MATFDDASSVLLLGHPFFGTLLMKMEHVPTTDIETLCVTRRQLKYNPDFLAKLSLDEAVFAVAHEVMHQAWQHLPRLQYFMDSGIGPDGKVLDAGRMNRAMDYPMNAALVDAKVGAAIPMDKFRICLDQRRFPATMVPEEVYCILAQEEEKSGGGGAKGKDGEQALDQHDAHSDADKEDAITPADVLQAASQHKAIKGEMPAGFERLLGELKKPEQSPWARLRNFITTSLPGHDASTWRRLQRRMIVRGVGMPGRTSQGAGRVGIVVDTSGSIGEEMLNKFAGHMAAIMDDARPRDVRIYWVDAAVHRVDEAKRSSELRAIMAKGAPGGGGTDMTKGVKAAEDDKCDSIVVLTDGYTPFCGSAKPLLWAITSHNITAPQGITIHI